MLEAPQVVETPAQHVAVIHLTIPRADIQKVMGPGIQELYATLASQAIAPAGPWFSHHLRMLPDQWDFEIGIPVARPVAPAGRVRPGERPAFRAAQTVYQGPYEGLGDAWGQFKRWVEAQGLAQTEDLWEAYVSGPESGPDASKYRTLLTQPLRG